MANERATPAAKAISPFDEETMTIRGHLDPDKHLIGDAIAAPSDGEIAATIGDVSSTGFSPFPARADHMHKLDISFYPVFFNVNPGANVDGTTGSTFVTWLTSGNITVPPWAINAIIETHLNSIFLITAVARYAFETIISGASYSPDRGRFEPAVINERHSVSYAGSVTDFGIGTQTVTIGARRISGTGQVRADPGSRITGIVHFRSA